MKYCYLLGLAVVVGLFIALSAIPALAAGVLSDSAARQALGLARGGKYTVVTFQLAKPIGTIYGYVPTSGASNGKILLYNSDGKRLDSVQPFGKSAPHGFTVSAVTNTEATPFLAVGRNRRGTSAVVYDVTLGTLRRVNAVKVASTNPMGKDIMVKFLNFNSGNDTTDYYRLVTFVRGDQSTLKVWRWMTYGSPRYFLYDKFFHLDLIDWNDGNIRVAS